MRGASGIHIKQHLCCSHIDDLVRLAERAVKKHEAEGCRFEDGTPEALEAHLLEILPDIIGAFLEGRETFCPERGIGVKEAA